MGNCRTKTKERFSNLYINMKSGEDNFPRKKFLFPTSKYYFRSSPIFRYFFWKIRKFSISKQFLD